MNEAQNLVCLLELLLYVCNKQPRPNMQRMIHTHAHTISSGELINERVERQRASDGHGGHNLGGRDEGVRGRVAVIALGEVAETRQIVKRRR